MPGVYILQSEKNNSYYIGSTCDIARRTKEHNSGSVTATKRLIPWKLKLFHKCASLTEAKRLEYKIKKLKRRDFLEKMISDGKITMGL